jgi:hypothetical protein
MTFFQCNTPGRRVFPAPMSYVIYLVDSLVEPVGRHWLGSADRVAVSVYVIAHGNAA